MGESTVQPEPQEPSGLELAPGVRVAKGAVRFAFSGSAGPGGQNVNKVATKAELRVALADLPIADDVRDRLAQLAGGRLTATGELVIASDEHRSQMRNRAECMARLRELLVRAMTRPKRRRPTRPTRGSVQRRLEAKRQKGETKRRRRPPRGDAG